MTASPVQWQVRALAEVESTQDVAMLAATQGNEEGFVVQALRQVGGRGRHGNKWEGPIGNLYMSVLLRPDCGVERAGEVAFVVAVALSNALDQYIDLDKHEKTLKWPNDVLVDGLKMSGILLESNLSKQGELNGLVIGMGVNIFNAPDLATSLSKVATDPVYVNKVRDTILVELDKAYRLWLEEGLAPIREKWLSQAHGIGQAITARLPNASHQGKFEGLTDDGSLILAQEDGTKKTITAGEVHFGEG